MKANESVEKRLECLRLSSVYQSAITEWNIIKNLKESNIKNHPLMCELVHREIALKVIIYVIHFLSCNISSYL